MKLKLASNIFVSTLLAMGAITFGISRVENQNNDYETAEASIPSGYYSSITDSMSGSTLLSALKSIINTSSVSVSYDWSRYEDADEDPNNTSNVILVYARNSVSKSAHVSGSTGWNREHTFPASKLSNSQAEKDNHIIYASDNKVNGARSNIKMGVVSSGTVVNDYNGNPTTCRKTTTLFDPNNRARGIVARTTMYAAAMYEYDPEDNFESIATMLRWHLEYPVDSFDTGRNDKVYNNQHNRNPFVDHPEYACRVWGNTNSTTQSICAASSTGITSISSTSTSVSVGSTTTISAVSSNSGQISWESSDPSVCSVSASTSSSGSSITLTGVSAGSATITASIIISGQTYSKTCAVTVTPTLSSISVSTTPSKLSYTEGEKFNPSGLVIRRNFSNNTNDTYTYSGHESEFTFTPSLTTSLATSNTSVTITYGGKSTTQEITVSESSGGDSSLTIAVDDIPTTYSSTSFTASGFSFGCSNIGNSYSSGNMQWKSGQGYMYNTTAISGITSITISNATSGSFSGTIYIGSSSHPTSGTSYSITNGNTVAISGSPSYFTIQAGTVSGGAKCGDITITYGSSSSSKTVTSIEVRNEPTKTTYTAGECFDPTGLLLKAYYSDSTNSSIEYAGHESDFTFEPSLSTPLTTSDDSVTITYGGQTCEQEITVNAAQAKTLTSIAVQTAPTKISYTVDDTFDPTGLVITRNYSDSTSDTYTYANHNSDFSFTPSLSTPLGVLDDSVTITYGGFSCSQAITVTTSGGSGGGSSESGSQRISASATSSYHEDGDICPTGSTSSASAECDAFTVSWLKNGGSNSIVYTYAELRVYASHSFTITPNDGYSITSIVITANNTNYANAVGGTALNNCTKDVSNTTVTLTPIDGESAVGFTNTAQSRLNYIVVNYESESSSTSYTGLLENGKYYITNSTSAYGLNGASSGNTPSALTLANITAPFDFTLVGDNLYEISVEINSVPYYLVFDNTSTSGSNTYIRVVSSPSASLKSTYWEITESAYGDGYQFRENNFGSYYRYLACYNSTSWYGYTTAGTNFPDQVINVIAADSQSNSVATQLNDLTCDASGTTAPSKSTWTTIASSITVGAEKITLQNVTANPNGNAIQRAMAKYDYIVGKYGTSNYSDFLGRNPSSLNSGAVLQVAQINDNMLITVISTLAIVSFVGFTYCLYIKKKRNRE